MRVSERGIVRKLAFSLELLAILQRGQRIFFLENFIQIARVIDADCVRVFPHGQRGGFEQAFRGLNAQAVEHLGVAFPKAGPEQPGYMGGGVMKCFCQRFQRQPAQMLLHVIAR